MVRVSDDGFQYVDRSYLTVKTRRLRRGRNVVSLSSSDGDDLGTKTSSILSQSLEIRRLELRTIDWFSISKDWMELNLKQLGLMTPIQSIVCLALGSFSSSQASELQSINQFTEPQKRSQFQLLVLLDVIIPVMSVGSRSLSICYKTFSDLKLLLVLRKAKLVDSQNSSNRLSVSFYDPAFTEYDIDFLKRSGFDPLDQEPDLRCEQTTFFYMPHAPLGLYERLISSNYQTLEKNSLDKVILLGNDLQNYLENMSLRDRLSTPLSCLDDQSIESRCAPDLSKLDREMSVYFFNDTNFQWFPRGQTCSSNEG
ncbi:expressed protein [Phakopsora pachyrhizi]|uniref:Expressed protein n=1 Tax=Phakopsora pachyrhizi TaxID=170000 RepID=A0AAV0ACZ7_PHAPC|nr:expressed protein [Phakopsora pachyrhizi]